MEFYLSDILDIVIEYIHHNKVNNKLVNSFYLPMISFIKINKKYYKFDVCKKHINLQYDSISFGLYNVVSLIVKNHILAFSNYSISFSVSFDTETFIEIVSILILLSKNIINNIKNELKNELENDTNILNYYNELNMWINNDCFKFNE